MAIALHTGSFITEIGSSDFLHALFSTISATLEPKGWGTRFPELMNHLYQGSLKWKESEKVISDLKLIKKELKGFPPSAVVWDIDDLTLQPPWGTKISSDITDLSNYFVTNNGIDLIQALIEQLERGIEDKCDTKIR